MCLRKTLKDVIKNFLIFLEPMNVGFEINLAGRYLLQSYHDALMGRLVCHITYMYDSSLTTFTDDSCTREDNRLS